MSHTQEPPRRLLDSFRYIGPGLIITASIVGSGELIVTPRVAGEHGFQLLWFILLGCMVKVFVQIELGRYAVARGVTTLQALNEIPGPRWRASWILWIWALVFVAICSQVGGIVGGAAEVFRAGGLNVNTSVMALVLGGSCALLLALGRYKLVEVFCTAMVVIFTVATFFAVVSLQWTEYRVTAAQLAEGFSFKLPSNFATAFAAFGIIGVGASELIYYPYWCLEKGYARRVGPRDGSAAWFERARGWVRVMRVDAWSSMVIYTGATAAFFMLGAAVLHAKGLKVEDKDMIPTLSNMYRESFGPAGLYIFLIGAFATLYSTVFSSTASNARLLVDGLQLFAVKKWADDDARARAVKWASIGLPLYAALLYIAVGSPVTLVMISGVGQAMLLPFLAGSALYFRYAKLDRELRPGTAWTAFLWLSALGMASVGIYQIIDQILKRLQ